MPTHRLRPDTSAKAPASVRMEVLEITFLNKAENGNWNSVSGPWENKCRVEWYPNSEGDKLSILFPTW